MYTVRAHEHVSAHPTLSWAKGMFQTCLNGLKGEGVTDVKLLRGDTTYFYATYKDGDIEVFTRDGTSVFKGKSGDPGVSTVMQTLEVLTPSPRHHCSATLLSLGPAPRGAHIAPPSLSGRRRDRCAVRLLPRAGGHVRHRRPVKRVPPPVADRRLAPAAEEEGAQGRSRDAPRDDRVPQAGEPHPDGGRPQGRAEPDVVRQDLQRASPSCLPERPDCPG
eukprot:m.226916 g.226916  ORF g.226916 m.226916 type:complete len:219 (+) comp25935_c1_seq12:6671-7327(+)